MSLKLKELELSFANSNYAPLEAVIVIVRRLSKK
jgi:hypothetical protein